MFHNKEFEIRSLSNESLRKKYSFFNIYVFTKYNFKNTSFEIQDIPSYIWDTTKIPINIKKYLSWIKNSL